MSIARNLASNDRTKPPGDDRPREKLLHLGAGALGDNELLAIVLASGTPSMSALELANLVLQAVGGVHALSRISLDDLRRLRGIGPARASQVIAATELGRRTLLRPAEERVQFLKPREIAAHLIPSFGSHPVEHFGVMLLDTKHRLLRQRIISIGTLDASVVHPREVFREATAASAATIVVFHNHPSGDPTPSGDDLELTKRLVRAGIVMGIEVLDHVIIAETRYFSFREQGVIQRTE
jgi:DNA repair protein RadC